jgi:hypothetical protein
VRQVDKTTWECTACGELVEVPRGKRPMAVLVTTSQGRQRVITVDGKVVHRCAPDIGEPLSLDAGPG